MPTSLVSVMDITQLTAPKWQIKPNVTNNNDVYFKSGKRSASIILQATSFTFRQQYWRDKKVNAKVLGGLYPDNPSDINIFDFIGNVPKISAGEVIMNDTILSNGALSTFHPEDHALINWEGNFGDTAAEQLQQKQDRIRASARLALHRDMVLCLSKHLTRRAEPLAAGARFVLKGITYSHAFWMRRRPIS